jgi:hypothetical protein
VGERLEEEVGERLREVGERLGGLGHSVAAKVMLCVWCYM